MFHCYSVTIATGEVYIGYDRNPDVATAFIKQAHKADLTRGSVQLLELVAGDETQLKFQLLSVHETEFQAYLARNTLRATNKASITPPCSYPPSAHKEARAHDPALVESWREAAKAHACKTARQAYQKYISPTYNQIMSAVRYHGKLVVDNALDSMTPLQFHTQIIATTPNDQTP